ncbi:MAG: SPOR domain-containing protein [Ignavibacteriae bacterium]|nr:SPOR domain-containing protein [Ignavibacteriota bacterium]
MAATATKKRLEFSVIIQWFGLIVLLIGCIYLAAQLKQQSKQLIGLNRLIVGQRVQINQLQKQVAFLNDTLGLPAGGERARARVGKDRGTHAGARTRQQETTKNADPSSQRTPTPGAVTQTAPDGKQQQSKVSDDAQNIQQSDDVTSATHTRRQHAPRTAAAPRRSRGTEQAASARANSGSKGYVLITGQFTTRGQALVEQQRLLSKGYPARVQGRGGRWSVSVGTFEHPHTARTYKAALERDLPGRSASIVHLGK